MKPETYPNLSRPRIWAVGGGKGGTGKSMVAASLAIHLAQMGRRVTLIDADLGGPNLHTFLGLDPPAVGLADFIGRRVESLEEAAVDAGIPRVRLVSGARNSLAAEQLKHFQKTRLQRALLDLHADIVVVDLGAGTSLNTLDLFAMADRGLLVALPEPTSVENGYRFLLGAFLRRLQRLAQTLGHQQIVDLVLRHRESARPPNPGEVLGEIGRIDAGAAGALCDHMREFRPFLVVNQVRGSEDARLGTSIAIACDRMLGLPVRCAGAIPYDPVLVRSVKSRRPYMVEYPRSRTAEAFRTAAEAMAAPVVAADAAGPGWHQPGDPYDVLDLRHGATHEEVLAAYLRIKPALRSGSPALLPLDCETERRAALADLERAFRTLSRNVSAGPRRSDLPLPRRVSVRFREPFDRV